MLVKFFKKLPYCLFKIPPEYLVLIFFGLVVIIIHILFKAPFVFKKWSTMFAIFAFIVILIMNLIFRLKRFFLYKNFGIFEFIKDTNKTIIDWFSFIILIIIYENLHGITNILRPDTMDYILMKFDEWLFGVQPTLWLEKYSPPLLIDYMAFAYALWLFLPLTIQVILYYTGKIKEFKALMLTQLFCYYIGFIGYICVPAIGPKYILKDKYKSPEIEGIYIQEKTSYYLDKWESIKRDCFPSLHTAISAVALLFAYKNRKKMFGGKIIFILWIPLVISVWLSTIFLREHWVIDVFAGLILSFFSYKISTPLVELWEKYNSK